MNACEIGPYIKKMRIHKNLKQAELAELLHVSPSSVSKWETGAAFPDLDNIKSIAEVLELPYPEILDDNFNFHPDLKPPAEPAVSEVEIPSSAESIPEYTENTSSTKSGILSFRQKVIRIHAACFMIGLLTGFLLYHMISLYHAAQEASPIKIDFTTDFYADSDYGYAHYIIIEYDGTFTDSYLDEIPNQLREEYPELFDSADLVILLCYDSYDANADTLSSADYILTVFP